MSSRNRSSRRVAISAGLIAVTRAAASSIANGMPSRRRQISATETRFAVPSVNSDRTATARSTKSWIASDPNKASVSADTVGTGSDGSANKRSPATPNPSRLVARTRTSGQRCRISDASRAASANKCSQLSNTTNNSRSRKNSTTLSAIDSPSR